MPLDRIVGSLGRAREFNREFLPRDESLRQRWQEVYALTRSPAGFPPVELYKVGDVYFVVDGHHRVSVAHENGAPAIEAHVQEFTTPVPLAPEESVDAVLLKQGLADFLEATGLTPEGPDDYRTTLPQGYERLLDHVSVHRWYRSVEESTEIPWRDAVESWRARVYEPVLAAIRRTRVLDRFPARTPTDVYLFVMDHLAKLKQRYGDPTVSPDRALRHLELSRQRELGWAGRLAAWWLRLWKRWFGGA